MPIAHITPVGSNIIIIENVKKIIKQTLLGQKY